MTVICHSEINKIINMLFNDNNLIHSNQIKPAYEAVEYGHTRHRN